MKEKIVNIISERIKLYRPKSSQELLNSCKETVQEMILLGLSRHGFFSKAAFHGGSALRIFHKLDRFSEDLDFCTLKTDKRFFLSEALDFLKEEVESWGLSVEVINKSKLDNVVKKAFLKESSLGSLLILHLPKHSSGLNPKQKIKIKLEIDTNPPNGAELENLLAEFPTDYYVTCHNLSTMFAGKIHALLSRKYVKGRDWYDLQFYLTKKIDVNYTFLRNALEQNIESHNLSLPNKLSNAWLDVTLAKRIAAVDFKKVKADVSPFLSDKQSITLWSQQFFLDKMNIYLKSKEPR